jgi:hypothetical protein
MARSTMADIIARCRVLIHDAGTPPVFSDDEIQHHLDLHRQEVRWQALRAEPTFRPGIGVTYQDYYATLENWEGDVVLLDMSYADVTAQADVAELLPGHWHFPTQPSGVGLRATGKTYDLYAACADLLEAWAAAVSLDFDVVTGGDQLRRSQKFEALTRLADRYRRLGLPVSGRIIQSDASPEQVGSGVTFPTETGGSW